MTANRPLDPDLDLLEAFGLTQADIDANRAGRLSPLQRRQLAASGTRNLLAALAAGVILAAILAFVADRPLKPAQYITAGLLFLAVLAVGIHDFRRTRAAGAAGVERLSGPVRVFSQGREGWQLSVANRTFRVPVRPWHIQNDAVYHVYFSPAANRIVAMERAE